MPGSELVTTDCPGVVGPVIHANQDFQLAFSTSYDPGSLSPGVAYDAYQRVHLVSPVPRRIMGASLTVEVLTS